VLDDDAASGEGDKAHRTAIGLRGHIPLHARLHVGAKTRSERACELQRVRRVCASLRDAAVVPTALQRGGRVVTRARVLVREVIVEARLRPRQEGLQRSRVPEDIVPAVRVDERLPVDVAEEVLHVRSVPEADTRHEEIVIDAVPGDAFGF